MKESLDTFEEKKYFLKEALKNGQIDEKTYEKMVKVLNQKNEDIKKHRENNNFWHSRTMKTFLWLLLFIVVALLFMISVGSWGNALGEVL